MTHTELIRQIRDIIRSLTNREFTGGIKVKDLKPQGYIVEFEAHQYHPVSYSADLPGDKFICFITKELKQAKFLRAGYHKSVRNTTLDHPLNSLVSPYDTPRINRPDR